MADQKTDGVGGGSGPHADPESVARTICLRQLEYGPRTRAQLATAMAKRHVPPDAAVAILDRFTEVGLIDDEAFASAWVESRHSARGLSRRALGHELRKKGVADETIAAALDSVDADDEREAAEALVARKLAATKSLATEARVRRLTGMLARKGYSPGLSFAVVREAIEAEGCELIDD